MGNGRAFSLLLVLLVASLPACDSNGTRALQPSDLLIDPEVAASLNAAGRRFDELSRTQTPEQARADLVAELNAGSDPSVTGALLTSDGYTIRVEFADGGFGLVNTNNDLFLPDDPLAVPLRSVGHYRAAATAALAQAASQDECDGYGDVLSPTSKRVLIFNAASLTDPWSPFSSDVESKLLELGWDPGDIDLVARDGKDDLSVNPDSLTDLRGYGLVVYVGHGGYTGGAPGQYYMQLCSQGKFLDVYTEERVKEWSRWGSEEQLLLEVSSPVREQVDGKIVTKEWMTDIAIDTDLMREHGRVEPGTMFFTLSCFSQDAAEDFLDSGAGAFLGWDGKTDDTAGVESFSALMDGMMGDGNPQPAADVLAGLGDTATSEAGGQLQLNGDTRDFHLPAWGSIDFDPDEVPPGTDHFVLQFPRADGEISAPFVQAGDTLDIEGLPPGTNRVTVKAIGADGGTLRTGIMTVDLVSGENTGMSLEAWRHYGLALSCAPAVVAPDGVSTSVVTARLRLWEPDDVTEPTGPTIPCRTVEFHTNFGTLVGANPVDVGNSGAATIEILSGLPGTATIGAAVMEDAVEEAAPAFVNFTEDGLTMVITGSPDPFTGSAEGQRIERVGQIRITTYVNDEACWVYKKTGITGLVGPMNMYRSSFSGEPGPCKTAQPGDTVRIVYDKYDATFTGWYLGSTWLHYFWGTDYANQKTVHIATLDPEELQTAPVEKTFELEDPGS